MSFIDISSFENAATSPYTLMILSLLSFSESAFFIIPPEVLLIPLAIASPQSALLLGLLTTITSVLGASFGYFIGQKGGKPILKKYFKEENINKVRILFHKYDAWAILVAAFTPIPFKLSTISAGAFDINRKRFLIASTVGRGSRYMIIASLLFIYGEPIKDFIENDLGKFMLIGTILVIFLAGFKKIAVPFLEQKLLKQTLVEKIKSFFPSKN